MRYDKLSTQTTWLYSLFAIVLSFFGFWAVCIIASLLTGSSIHTAFRHKVLFLIVICILQFALVSSSPIKDAFQVWLRVCTVVAGIVFSCEMLLVDLSTRGLVSSRSGYLWLSLTILFAILAGAFVMRRLKKHLPDQHALQLERNQ